MNNPIAEGYAAWLNADWQWHCPVVDDNGQRCHLILDEFTTHTMICPVHGMGEKEFAIPWAVCELQS